MRPGKTMAPFSQGRIQRVATVQESKHRRPAHSDFFKRPANPEIASCGDHTFFQGLNRFRRSSSLVVNLGKVQIELGVIVFHSQRFAAERFRVSEALFRERGQQPRIRKVKRVLGRHT